MKLDNAKRGLLSIYENGVWYPYSISNITFKKLNPRVRYAILQDQVGLLDVGETNPSNVKVIGTPGSYIFKNDEGGLVIMTPQAGDIYVKYNGN
jgi:hypothetical protein